MIQSNDLASSDIRFNFQGNDVDLSVESDSIVFSSYYPDLFLLKQFDEGVEQQLTLYLERPVVLVGLGWVVSGDRYKRRFSFDVAR